MKGRTDYIIQFSSLIEEIERYEFHLGESFFKIFESDQWSGGNINAVISVAKSVGGFTFDFQLTGELKIMCDRCLDYFDQEIEFEQRLFLKFGDERSELDDNIIVIPREDTQLDLSQFLYEYLILALPVKKVHPDKDDATSGCNSAMIEMLEEYSVDEGSDEIDPRWSELKKLMDKN